MRRTNIFHPLWMSFYSRSMYRDVAERWSGTGFLYLLILVALSWILPIVQFHRSTNAFLETLGPAVVEQIPTITIHQGEVSIQEPQPYVIRVPGSDTPLMVIDTTGGTTPENSDALLLINRHQVIARKNPSETRIYDLGQVQDLTINRQTVERLLTTVRKYIAPVSYPFAVLFSYVYRILQALIYASIGLGFANLFKAPLDYLDLLRLSCVAVTPAIVADTIRPLLGFESSFLWWIVCFGIAMGYLMFAVRVNSPAESEENEAVPPAPLARGGAAG